MSRKRSMVWRFFRTVDSQSVKCVLCRGYQARYVQGSTTTAMLRHLRVKHPKEVAKKCKGRAPGAVPRNVNQDVEMDSERYCFVEVLLEDEGSDIHTTLDKSNMNGIREPTQENPAEQLRHVGASDNHSVRQGRHQRSLIWRHFERLDSSNACCRICMRKLQCSEGSTSNLHRHMSKRHPELFAKLSGLKPPPSRSSQGLTANGDTSTPAEIVGSTEQGQISVEVLLEDEGSDIHTTLDKSNMNGIREPTQENPAEQLRHVGASDDHSVRQGRHQRSLIWRHFVPLDSSNAVCCSICMRKLQCSEGSTSNLHRHMSKRHPELFAKLSGLKPPPSRSSQGLTANGDTSTPAEIVGSTEQGQISVDMLLEDEDPDSHTTMDESDISSAINGILESAQEDPAEQIGHGGASDDHSVSQGRHQRSLIWRHFERLNSLNAARCRICMRKLQCFDGGSTSNLHRHMSKRHPELFAKLVPGGLKPPPSSLSHGLTANSDTSTPAKIVGSTEQGQISGVLKGTRPFLRQKRVLKRERELIEALRRTQKEEARTLEHQRELLEKLRAANAREAAAEREEIESLRKAQQEEAKELNAQREELQREKAELQKKWEELQQLACTI